MSKLQDNIRNLLDLNAEGPAEPITPVKQARPMYHSDECPCESCNDIRAAVDNYQKARAAFYANGFN